MNIKKVRGILYDVCTMLLLILAGCYVIFSVIFVSVNWDASFFDAREWGWMEFRVLVLVYLAVIFYDGIQRI
jgi:hypothetical protein